MTQVGNWTQQFLKNAEIVRPSNDDATRRGRSGQWAVQAYKMLRAIKEVEKIELEIGLVNEKQEAGEIGNLLQESTGSIDGICAHLSCWIDGEMLRLGRARAYHVKGKGGDWWVLADPMLANFLRGNRLHEKLVAARALACLQIDVPARENHPGSGTLLLQGGRTGLPRDGTLRVAQCTTRHS